MRLLLIDTCGTQGSVALASDEGVIASETLPGRSASERLVAAVRELLKGVGWRLSELTTIVVVHGPGSFTGVRVGVSAAKGLSEAVRVPVVAVSRLALVAAKAGEAAGKVVAALDAGRGEFYCGVYEHGRCGQEALMSAEEVVAESAGAAVVVCEERVVEALVALKPRLMEEPVAGDALWLARERIAAGMFDDVATLDANYLRRTDVEIFAKQRQGAGQVR